MDKSECARLEAYLRRLFGAKGLAVVKTGRDKGELQLDGAKLAEIERDDDEGELSYFLSMGIARAAGAPRGAPLDASERARLENVLRIQLEAPSLTVKPRPPKTDSAEVYVGDEFIGTLSSDDASAQIGYFLTMSVLELDLE